MDERSDAKLVSDTLAGDRGAFARLVRRYQDHAYGTAIAVVSDFELACDVVQEAFLRAWHDLRKLRSPERFAPWSYGIVRNLARHAARDLAQVHSLAEAIGRQAKAIDPSPDPDESAQQAEIRAIVQKALERLNERQREAVSLYYVDGLSYRDIAAFLDVSEATVQGRVQRGRETLRRELEMVRDAFEHEKLPGDFTDQVRRLLDSADSAGQEHEEAVRRLAEIGGPAVLPLCAALDDPRLAVGRAAAKALCRIADPAALKSIMVRLFRAAHVKRSWQAAVISSGEVLRIPGVREAVLELVREGTHPEVWAAMRVLGHLRNDPEALATVLAVFRGADSEVRMQNRRAALEALCRMAPGRELEFLTEALRSTSRWLRQDAARQALRRGLLPPTDACLNAFGNDTGWAERYCAGVLVLRHGEAGRSALEEMLRTGHGPARATAALALAREGSARAVDVLKQELGAGRADRKWLKIVAGVLGRHHGRSLAASLQDQPPVPPDFRPLLWALARSECPEGGPMIESLFRDPGELPSVRQAALRILARQRGVAFLPELRRCLHERTPRRITREAFWEMVRMGEAVVGPTAHEMLHSKDWTERRTALCLLRRWGKLPPEEALAAANDLRAAIRHAARPRPPLQR